MPTNRLSLPLLGVAGVLAAAVLPTTARAQAEFVNYEVAGVAPLASIRVSAPNGTSRHLLLVCNTPGDRLEVCDATTLGALASIPTGMAPVTVRWHQASATAYVCNFIGDSVTRVGITAANGSSGTPNVQVALLATTPVGDEPADILFVPGTDETIVTLRGRSSVTIRRAADLSPILDRLPLVVAPTLADDPYLGVRHPTLMHLASDRLLILDRHSDAPDSGTRRLDLFVADARSAPGGNPLTNPASVEYAIAGLGTAHHAMAVDRAGSLAVIVGSKGMAEHATGESAVAALPTGFVQSWLWVVDLASSPIAVRAEAAGAGRDKPSINLNRNYAVPGTVAVDPALALANPTGVAILEDAAGVLRKLVLTAQGSDKVAVLAPNPAAASGWRAQQISLPPLAGYSLSSPQAVVIDETTSRAFVACRDNSVAVIDLAAAQATVLGRVVVGVDPTPAAIRTGRRLLYSAAVSGSGTVSCASCHIDGHTDAIAWDLSSPTDQRPFSRTFLDLPANSTFMDTRFAPDKGPMVTQTLRGLVNHPVAGAAQAMFTNAPYHWRGDRPGVADFAEAFVGLLGAATAPSGAEMAEFTTFVNTIVHPPNPEQALDRRVAGSLGGSPDDPALGSGAARGMKLFHQQPVVEGLACVHCHAMPDGSSNRTTQVVMKNGRDHPLEPAALRSIFDREAVLNLGPQAPPEPPLWLQETGLFHTGIAVPVAPLRSINDFLHRRFRDDMPADTPAEKDLQIADVVAFVRQLDSGTAPLIGRAHTLLAGSATNQAEFDRMQEQVEQANVGVVAWTRLNGVALGFRYDLERATFVDDASGRTVTFASLQAAVTANPANVVVLQTVPIGSERRIAGGVATARRLTGPAPGAIELLPMAPPTQWELAGSLTRLWNDTGAHPLLEPRRSHRAMRAMQAVLLAALPAFDVGVHQRKHEPPRRFRVAGTDIRLGARLRLDLPTDTTTTIPLELPLFPTRLLHNGKRVWETTVEADAEQTLMLLVGGPFRARVEAVRVDPTLGAALQPAQDNRYTVTVINTTPTGDQPSAPVTAILRIQDHR